MQKKTSGRRSRRAAHMAAACLLPWLAACSLTAPKGSEGYADFGRAGGIGKKPALVISIGPSVLRFAAAHSGDDAEISRLLQDLDGVVIRIYEVDGDAQRIAGRITRMNQALEAKGWQQVLLVRDAGEETRMLVKMRDGSILGLALLASDGEEEAVVINLMGDIPPARFSDVMLALDVDVPGAKGLRVAGSAN